MKHHTTLVITLLAAFNYSFSQTDIKLTNPVAEQILLGNYDPADYVASDTWAHPSELTDWVNQGVSPDSLLSYLKVLRTFKNRNTGSDTLSATEGIGAARRWVYSRFEEFSGQVDDRLIVTYLQFDQEICGMGRHKNTIAILPGMDLNDKGIILIEGHIDSRCDDRCDTGCLAEGMEDNGSGTALVMELARVMSRYHYDHTIVFMATTGEEQGLLGANAFAQYTVDQDILVKAVLNNDIVGGIICGETSSPPSCPGFNHIDSTQVRLFSAGSFSSPHKQLARFIKLEYQEELEPVVRVPMLLTIMSGEDRVGRGGDHIPFRQRGIPAMRFTSANEHGNGAPDDPDYHDRQHTSDDILGVDTDNDGEIDSFFVDFNYLARNVVINGNAAAMAAVGPVTPDFKAVRFVGVDSIYMTILDPVGYGDYRYFVRTSSHDFDTMYVSADTSLVIPVPEGANQFVYVSGASVDSNGVESLFSEEIWPFPPVVSVEEVEEQMREKKNIVLAQNRPNPFDEATYISFYVRKNIPYKEAYIRIGDLNGKEIKRIPVQLEPGMNEILYTHGYNVTGVYTYSLVVDGQIFDTKRMIFNY